MKLKNLVIACIFFVLVIIGVGIGVQGGIGPMIKALTGAYTSLDDSGKISFTLLICLFAGLLVINFISILIGENNYKKISEDVSLLSEGNTNIVKPSGNSEKVVKIWRGLNQVGKKIDKYKYLLDNSSDTIYKFVPKNVEVLWGKNSLYDLMLGESTTVDGIMTIVTANDIRNKNWFVEMINEYEVEQKSIIVAKDTDLTKVKMLSPDKNAKSVEGFLNLNSNLSNEYISALIYSARFNCSIVGTENKMIPCITSNEDRLMEKMADWFQSLKLRMVITEDIKDKERVYSPLRYLGYVEVNGEKKNFYEVLNANAEVIRAVRMDHCNDFEKALKLLYEGDYYLARTAFSDILKDDITDEISRWYLFICEKYLNSQDKENVSFELNPRHR